jgi:hypothetical protein
LLDYGLILEKTIGGNLKDWRAIAAAYRVDLKGPDLDRAIQALERLEESFQPLVAGLSPETEPATTFEAGEKSA